MSKKAVRRAPQKSCPKCSAKVHARVKACPKCGRSFVTGHVEAPRMATAMPVGDDDYDIADIQAAKAAISKLGGASRAKQLVDALA